MQSCVVSRSGTTACRKASVPTQPHRTVEVPSRSRLNAVISRGSSSSASCSTPSKSSSSSGWSEATARGLITVAAAACVSLGIGQQPAWSKPALLDLPACNKFKGDSPVKYCEVQAGSGESPLAGDLIVVDYTARAVATGQVYDGSRNFKFTVGNDEVIPGWEQGILGTADIPAVKEGGARTLLVPPELAYGEKGDGCLFGLPDSCRIPPNSPVEITFKYRGLGY